MRAVAAGLPQRRAGAQVVRGDQDGEGQGGQRRRSGALQGQAQARRIQKVQVIVNLVADQVGGEPG